MVQLYTSAPTPLSGKWCCPTSRPRSGVNRLSGGTKVNTTTIVVIVPFGIDLISDGTIEHPTVCGLGKRDVRFM